MSTLYSIVARGQRYIEYAALCINGLINNGGVNPNNIIVTVHEWDLNNSQFGIRILKEFGVTIETDNNNIIAKHLIVDRLFKKYQDFTHIVNIDADCVYTGIKSLKDVFEIEEDIGAWTHNCDPVSDFLSRYSLLAKAIYREEYNSWVYNTFGISLTSNIWYNYLTKNGWIFGGIISYNRNITKSYNWISKILPHCHSSGCDETPIQICRASDSSFKFKEINSLEVKHIVNPENLALSWNDMDRSTWSLPNKNAFIHFAGDHYRLHNEVNKNIIADEYYTLVQSMPERF